MGSPSIKLISAIVNNEPTGPLVLMIIPLIPSSNEDSGFFKIVTARSLFSI